MNTSIITKVIIKLVFRLMIWSSIGYVGSLFFPQYSWAQRKKNRTHSTVPIPSQGLKLTQAEAVQLEYEFIDGLKFFLIEDYTQALKVFKKCIKTQPQNAVFSYQASRTLVAQNQLDEALNYALKAQELAPQEVYYYEQLVQIYERRSQYVKMTEVLQKLIQETGGSHKHYLELALVLSDQEKYQEAIAVYDQIEAKFGMNATVTKEKQKIYIALSDIPSAIKAGKKLIQAFPDETDYYTSQAQLLIKYQKPNEAELLLKKATEIDPKNPRIRLIMSELYELQGKSERQVEQLKLTFQNPDLEPVRKINVLRSYLTKSADPKFAKIGLELTEIALKPHPDNAYLQEIYGKFLTLNGKFKKAILAFEIALKLNPNNYGVWERLIQLQIQTRDIQKVLITSENALEYFPNQATFWLYNGNANLLTKNYAEAIDALEQGQMLAFDNADLQFQILNYLGASYHGLKDYEASDETFAEALSLRPNAPNLLNNYSYYLAQRGEKLDEAKRMCQKLLENNSESPTYLDTYAWVLYVARDYKKALKYIEKAAKISPNGTILEHYGDILYQLGSSEEALLQWKKAKEMGGNTTQNLDRKIAEKRIVE